MILTGEVLTSVELAKATLIGKLVKRTNTFGPDNVGIVVKVQPHWQYQNLDAPEVYRHTTRLVITIKPDNGPRQSFWLDDRPWEVYEHGS